MDSGTKYVLWKKVLEIKSYHFETLFSRTLENWDFFTKDFISRFFPQNFFPVTFLHRFIFVQRDILLHASNNINKPISHSVRPTLQESWIQSDKFDKLTKPTSFQNPRLCVFGIN